MCVGIPMKIAAVDGNIGTVEEAGVQREIGLDLIEEPRIGHYVIVHAGYAIEQLDPAEAEETLALLRRVHILDDDGHATSVLDEEVAGVRVAPDDGPT